MEIRKEESSSWVYGGSHLVPCVQELAKKPITTIPPRYIQQGHDGDAPNYQVNKINSGETRSSVQLEIPFIDMKKLLSQQGSNSSDDSDELARLHLACKEWGFFQVRTYVLHVPLIN